MELNKKNIFGIILFILGLVSSFGNAFYSLIVNNLDEIKDNDLFWGKATISIIGLLYIVPFGIITHFTGLDDKEINSLPMNDLKKFLLKIFLGSPSVMLMLLLSIIANNVINIYLYSKDMVKPENDTNEEHIEFAQRLRNGFLAFGIFGILFMVGLTIYHLKYPNDLGDWMPNLKYYFNHSPVND